VGSSAKEVILLMFLSCNCDVFFCFLGLIVTVIILVVRPDAVVSAHFSTYELPLPVLLPEVCEHVQGTLEALHKYWFAWAPTSNGLCYFLLACTDYLEVFAGVSSTTNCSARRESSFSPDSSVEKSHVSTVSCGFFDKRAPRTGSHYLQTCQTCAKYDFVKNTVHNDCV